MWQQLRHVDQKAIIVGVITLLLIVVYFMIIEPWHHRLNTLKHDVAHQRTLLTWMQPVCAQLQRRTPAAVSNHQHASLATIIDQGLEQQQIKSYLDKTPDTHANLLQFKLIPFDTLITYLASLQNDDIIIDKFDAATLGKGLVIASLQLGKNNNIR